MEDLFRRIFAGMREMIDIVGGSIAGLSAGIAFELVPYVVGGWRCPAEQGLDGGGGGGVVHEAPGLARVPHSDVGDLLSVTIN